MISNIMKMSLFSLLVVGAPAPTTKEVERRSTTTTYTYILVIG